jgi:hypothetical protein
MTAKRIMLAGEFRGEEDLADGTVSPGMLLERTSTPKVKAHATEGGYAERAFALDDALQGNTVATDYATGKLVFYALAFPGAEVQAILKAGENVAIGAKLVSAGDGKLIAEGSVSSGVTVKQIIAIAQEALDLSGSGDVDTFIAVRVL